MMAVTFYRQQGAALLVSMLMLLIITVLALNSMRGSILQEQMTANQYDYQLAFQAAEAALRHGEQLRRAEPPPAGFVTLPAGPTPPIDHWRTIESSFKTVPIPTGHGLAKLPRVLTEELDFDSNNNTSRIRVTAIGYGAREETRVVLQSIVAL